MDEENSESAEDDVRGESQRETGMRLKDWKKKLVQETEVKHIKMNDQLL